MSNTRNRLLMLVGSLFLLVAAGVRAAPAHAQTPVANFRGTLNGKQLIGPVDLHQGLVVIRARTSGNQNFIVGLILPKPGVDPRETYEDGYGMINVLGQYNGSAATSVRKSGSYMLDVDASGTYDITVEQPDSGPDETAGQRSFSGKGQQVTPIFVLPEGTIKLTMTHDGKSNFQVWLYDLGGATVSGDGFGRLINEIGPANGTVELEIVIGSPALFYVNADGNWSITIE
jgi:hypothetical protein